MEDTKSPFLLGNYIEEIETDISFIYLKYPRYLRDVAEMIQVSMKNF